MPQVIVSEDGGAVNEAELTPQITHAHTVQVRYGRMRRAVLGHASGLDGLPGTPYGSMR